MNALYNVDMTTVTINGVQHQLHPDVAQLLWILSQERDSLRITLHQILAEPATVLH